MHTRQFIPRQKSSQLGFTLIEMLIALVIFALLSGVSYQALQVSIISQEKQQKSYADLNQLQNALLFLERDLAQMFNGALYLNKGEILFQGLQNNKTILLRYSLENNNLVRQDLSDGVSKPPTRILIKEITNLEFKILTNEGTWLSLWPLDKLARDQITLAVNGNGNIFKALVPTLNSNESLNELPNKNALEKMVFARAIELGFTHPKWKKIKHLAPLHARNQ